MRYSLFLILNSRIDFRFIEIVSKSLKIMRHIICDRHVFWISFDIPKESAYHYSIESSFFTTQNDHLLSQNNDIRKKNKFRWTFCQFGFCFKSHKLFSFLQCQIKKNGKLRLFTSELLLMVVVKRNQELTSWLSLKISI